jgi:hypothetical protein
MVFNNRCPCLTEQSYILFTNPKLLTCTFHFLLYIISSSLLSCFCLQCIFNNVDSEIFYHSVSYDNEILVTKHEAKLQSVKYVLYNIDLMYQFVWQKLLCRLPVIKPLQVPVKG